MKKHINQSILAQQEAAATVRKTKSGRYYDLHKKSLKTSSKTKLTHNHLMALFEKLRLRFALTPKCNAWCIFCSNEGSKYLTKTQCEADMDLVIKLSEMLLRTTPLKSIDFSGGEPTMHSDFLEKRYKLINWTKKHPQIRFSLHTNGLALEPDTIKLIKNHFARIGVSVHSLKFETWNQMTNLHNRFPFQLQKRRFQKLLDNLDFLKQQNIGHKVFLKSVIMRGINDSEPQLESFLESCRKYGFHPKLLEFEPQFLDQKKYNVGRHELFGKLEKLGCIFPPGAPRHNKPNTYIPGVNFEYKEAPTGLHSIFGCGTIGACKTCYDFLCLFVKPTEDGTGLYLKPCSVLDTRIDLTHAIPKNDHKHLLELFRVSREYLMTAPGLGAQGWNKESEFKYQ